MSVSPNGQTALAPNGQTTVDPNGTPASQANQPGAAPPDASARMDSAVLNAPPPEQASPERDLIREWFRPRVETASSDPAPKSEPATGTESKDGSDTTVKTTGQTDTGTEPGVLRLTEAELSRRVQSEVDRREAVRAQKARDDSLRELRKKDPYKFVAEVEKQEEEQLTQAQLDARASQFATQQIYEFDRNVMDQIVAIAPDSPEKQAALQAIGEGAQGRRVLTQTMLDLYTKSIAASTRKALADDQVFVKEILARYGGQRFEPDVVSAVAGNGTSRVDPDAEMEGFIRRRGRPAR